MLRWSTAGESHGQALVAILEGMPAGVAITSAQIADALTRRRVGYGRGSRQGFEQDELTIISGIRHGKTIGSPIALEIKNSEWDKWQLVMSADPVDPAALMHDAGAGDNKELARNKKLTRPRPGHADLVGMNKYGFDDARLVLERASARETAARVALGQVAKNFLYQVTGVQITSQVVQMGTVTASAIPTITPADIAALDASPVRSAEEKLAQDFMLAIDNAKKSGDTLGGVVEVVAFHVPPALGTYTVDMQRLDARIAAAMMSIPAVKGVEIGAGFQMASMPGSTAHDEIVPTTQGMKRLSNNAGGIEGGMSNGEPIRVKIAFKPISTVPHALRTIDTETGLAAWAIHQRSDVSAVVPGAVVAEAMLALVLAEAMGEKFGGDTLTEVQRNYAGWLASIPRERM